ncbi:MAG: cytochrome c3 family protein [Saprospiraceae bacterium]
MKKILVIVGIVLAVLLFSYFTGINVLPNGQINWQAQVSPGGLSAAHAQLATACASCHTATRGVDDAKCISCHGGNTALLQRKPTAFHAIIANCASCHVEHRGAEANLRVMDHEALARIAATMINSGMNKSIVTNSPVSTADYPLVSELVARLNCANCHSTKDKHKELLGQNCATCHSASEWTIPAFQHPSVNAVNCAQCHQAPPSHYMEHFSMVSKKIAGQEKALVNQCQSCHQTTSFNDIKGVGYYKHH